MNTSAVEPVPPQSIGSAPRQKPGLATVRWFLLLLFLALPVLGCSQAIKGHKVNGEVIPPDNLSLGDQDMLRVDVQGDIDGKSVGNGAPVKDNKFTLIGPEKKGLPPGKYNVTVGVAFYVQNTENAKKAKAFKDAMSSFKGNFEVGSSDVNIVVDLKKKTVTTK